MLGLVCEWPLIARAIHTQLQRLIICLIIPRDVNQRSVCGPKRRKCEALYFQACRGNLLAEPFPTTKVYTKKETHKNGPHLGTVRDYLWDKSSDFSTMSRDTLGQY